MSTIHPPTQPTVLKTYFLSVFCLMQIKHSCLLYLFPFSGAFTHVYVHTPLYKKHYCLEKQIFCDKLGPQINVFNKFPCHVIVRQILESFFLKKMQCLTEQYTYKLSRWKLQFSRFLISVFFLYYVILAIFDIKEICSRSLYLLLI